MTVDEKRDLILAHEQVFAKRLAYTMVANPSIHIWMILIPIIFVFYFQKLSQAKEGRKMFVDGYMQSRLHTLNGVWELLRQGQSPLQDNTVDPAFIDRLCSCTATPEPAMAQYRAFIALLAEHYTDLLNASGETAEDLIRSVYRSRSNYLLFLRQMGEVERNFNAALQPHLPESVDGVQEVLKNMERTTKELRKEQAEAIFV